MVEESLDGVLGPLDVLVIPVGSSITIVGDDLAMIDLDGSDIPVYAMVRAMER